MRQEENKKVYEMWYDSGDLLVLCLPNSGHSWTSIMICALFVPPVLLLNISQWTNFSVFSNVMDGTNWGFSVLVIYVFLLLITCSSKERMEEVQDKKKGVLWAD